MCWRPRRTCGMCCRCDDVLEVPEEPEVIRFVLLCMLEAPEAPEVMRCVLLCMPEALEGRFCLPEEVEVVEVSKVVEVSEVMRCVLLTLYAGDVEVVEMPEVMRCVLSVC